MSTTDKSWMEKMEKKRLWVSSYASEHIEEEQVAIAELLEKISLIEQRAVEREVRMKSLETHPPHANSMIKKLKKKTDDLENSVEFTQKDQAEDRLIRQEIYSRCWNMFLYKDLETLCNNIV